MEYSQGRWRRVRGAEDGEGWRPAEPQPHLAPWELCTWRPGAIVDPTPETSRPSVTKRESRSSGIAW